MLLQNVVKEGTLSCVGKKRTDHGAGLCQCYRASNSSNGDLRWQIPKLSMTCKEVPGTIGIILWLKGQIPHL